MDDHADAIHQRIERHCAMFGDHDADVLRRTIAYYDFVVAVHREEFGGFLPSPELTLALVVAYHQHQLAWLVPGGSAPGTRTS